MKVLRCLLFFCALAAGPSALPKDLYVSPAGNDKAAGTAARPLRTLAGALSKAGALPGDSLRIFLLDGTYPVDSALVLRGFRQVRLEAAPGASPTLRGDLSLGRWKPLRDRRILERIPSDARGRVLQADLGRRLLADCGEACRRENHIDLYCDGVLQRLARWPDEGFLTSGEALGATPRQPFGTEEGVFAYQEDRISTWAGERDAWLFGYFYWDWWDSFRRIASIDPSRKVMTLEDDESGIRTAFRYYGVNLLCELDCPGEYYLDRDAAKMYWYPPVSYDGTAEVTVSRFRSPQMLRIEGCEDIVVRGITFVGGRENAIGVEDSHGVLLQDVTVRRFGGDALQIARCREVTVDGCTFETLGHSGIRAIGGDRKTLTDAGYVVHNTLIRDFSLFKHTYQPAVFFDGCGLTVSHCECCGSYSSALRIDGSDVCIEYNYFHDLVKESDDQGGLDMWYNYGYRGVMIRYNLWENILGGSLHGAAGVRFDDMISGQTVYGNIFNNVGSMHFGGVQIHGGKDNVVENNVFYRCLAAVSLSPWPADYWAAAFTREDVQQQLHRQVEIDGDLYKTRFPELREDPLSHPNRNVIRNNLAVGCRQFSINENGQNALENNNAIAMGDDPQVGPLEEYLSPAFLHRFGMKPIPYGEIGRLR